MDDQTSSVLAKTNLNKQELIDRIQGCMFGGALGDAFGLATEFMTKVNATHLYGVGPIKFGKAEGFEFWQDGHRTRWYEHDFTDDTDQLLLILQCLLGNDGVLIPQQFAYRLREWTEIGFPQLDKPPCGIGFTVGSVIRHEDFLTKPFKSSYEVWNSNKRNLAPNGAVMRTSILGIPSFWNEQKVVQNAIKAAKVTHADPRSILSAVIVSVIVSRLLIGPSKNQSEINHDQLNQLMLQGTDLAQPESLEPVSPPLLPKARESMPVQTEEIGIFRKIQNFFKPKKIPSSKARPNFKFPDFKPLDRQRAETPAKIPQILPKSIDDYGIDPEMESLSRKVFEDYKFLIESNPFYSDANAKSNSDAPEERSWLKDLEFYCFCSRLSDLKLDDKKSMGYTFKCLGAGLFALTRAKQQNQSDADFFKSVITQITLEAGDADSNCAVAGALLGARLGRSALPDDWASGLRHADFLEKMSNDLISSIFKN